MSAAFAAVGTIVAVGDFAFQNPYPKPFALIGLLLRFTLLYNLNREIFNPAVLHCLTEWRIGLAVLQETFFKRLARLSDVYLPIQAIRYLVYRYHCFSPRRL